MAVTTADIVTEFPEVANAPSAVLTARLADAERLTALDYDPALRDMRVKYYALELVALSPGGEFARLDPSKESDGARSIYERMRLTIDRSYSGPMVV
jgi:hypothetical protein